MSPWFVSGLVPYVGCDVHTKRGVNKKKNVMSTQNVIPHGKREVHTKRVFRTKLDMDTMILDVKTKSLHPHKTRFITFIPCIRFLFSLFQLLEICIREKGIKALFKKRSVPDSIFEGLILSI